MPDQPPKTRIPKSALWLGLTGAIPFAAGTFANLFPDAWPDLTAVADLAVRTYGAVILSFLGGVRWGLGMHKEREARSRALALSVVPALFGWFALFLPAPWTFPALVVGFAVQGFWDVKTSAGDGAPAWYPRLRIPLTLVVCLLLILCWLTGPPG